MYPLTPIGGLLLAILLAVDSQTKTSSTFELLMAVAAGICFVIDIFAPVARGSWRRGPPVP